MNGVELKWKAEDGRVVGLLSVQDSERLEAPGSGRGEN